MPLSIRAFHRAGGPVAVILIAVLALTAATTRAGSPVIEDGATAALEAPAATGPLLSYQGRLVDPNTGAPKSGTFAMTLRLYGQASGGSALWTETKNVVVTNGLFSTLLGDTTALNLAIFDGRDLWLGVQVSTDSEALPRIPVAYAPYTLYSGNSAKLGGQLPGAFSAAGHNHDAAYVNDNAGEVDTADVPVGALSPDRIAGTAWTSANDGHTSGMDADLLDGQQSYAFAAAGHNHLGETWNLGPNSTGLALGGNVSWSASLLQAFNHGSGPSIWGINDGGGNAVRGQGGGASLGVYGQAENAAGVAGRSSGNDGVVGISSADGKSGVFGNHEGSGYGVYGNSEYGTGVFGTDGGPNPDDNWAVWASGDMRTTGDLTVGLTLYVGGYATFAGGKQGFVVDIAQNDDAEPLMPGDVVSISGAGPAVLGEIPVIKVRRATAATATGVMGVVDGRFTLTTTSVQAAGADGAAQEKVEASIESVAVETGQYLTVVTLGAYKAVKVDATYGPISPGDLLVASPNPGYAMRATTPPPGTVIGKSLGSLASGAGMVPVLVTLQ